MYLINPIGSLRSLHETNKPEESYYATQTNELERRKKKMRVRKVSFRHHAKRRETVTQEIRRRRTSGKIDEERARLMERR